MVDTNGQPYCNVFAPTDRKNASAELDWPDLGALTARYLDATIHIRQVTGRRVNTET